jgi:hypothetical protein
MKLIVTEDKKFLRIAEADEIELEQLNFSLKKRIRGWFYNPLVKKNCGMGMCTSARTTSYPSVSGARWSSWVKLTVSQWTFRALKGSLTLIMMSRTLRIGWKNSSLITPSTSLGTTR